LMTVHRHPKEFSGLSSSLGGQAKKQNIMNSLGWSPLLPPDEVKTRVLSHLAHEGHHIWFMYAFNLNEGVYWWSEGVTEYISQKALYELGFISEEEFQRDLIQKFIAYNSLSIRNDVDLVQATRVPDPTEEETSLQYDKGALVAYLLDQRLQARGQNIEILLTDFYRSYALTQKPIDNQELVNYIDSYLGESSFTEDYVLGTKQLPLSEFNFGWHYYWGTIERYLPPVPFPYNVLIPLVAIFVILAAGRLIYKVILARILSRRLKQ
ncbi:MAG TPA: hypothetical protein VKP08_21375, partial [Anaerolineales bacterium]|nr:hypothetical protein [Anaerolineales bacterium]